MGTIFTFSYTRTYETRTYDAERRVCADSILQAISHHIEQEMPYIPESTPQHLAATIRTKNNPTFEVDMWFDPDPEEGQPTIAITLTKAQ